MRLNEMQYPDARPIDGYGPGYFRIGGEAIEGPLLVMPSGTRAWGGLADTDSLLAVRDEIDVIFIGTGPEIAHVPPGLRDPLEEAGLGVETMASPAACRTYNVLLAEGRRIAAALLPV